jgi:hypothetical protein
MNEFIRARVERVSQVAESVSQPRTISDCTASRIARF